jgi:transcriptional regulator with XRE-family HTH domain
MTDMLKLRTLGERAKKARLKKGWTLDVLAAKTKLSKSFLSEMERSKKFPCLHTLEGICKKLGVKLI